MDSHVISSDTTPSLYSYSPIVLDNEDKAIANSFIPGTWDSEVDV